MNAADDVKTTLGVAPGLWQLITLAAGLDRAGIAPRNCHLVLPFEPGHPLGDAARRAAGRLGPWRSVVADAGEVAGPVLQVWVNELQADFCGGAIDRFPEAAVTLYEDGLNAFNDDARLGRDLPPRELARRAAARAYRLRSAVARRRRRVSRFVGPLAGRLPLPAGFGRCEAVAVGGDALLATLRRAGDATEPPPADTCGRPRALLLGQCLSWMHHMPRDAEVALHADVARELTGRGYAVLYKDHPRADPPFGPELATAVPGVEVVAELGDAGGLPLVEAWMMRHPVDAVVGLVSSSLLYAPLLFGTPTYTAAGRLPRLTSRRINELGRLTRLHVPPLEDLPAASQDGVA